MNKRNTRDLGLKGGGAGKGDSPRYTHNENWITNYEAIDWGRSNQTPVVPSVPQTQPPPIEWDNHCPAGQGDQESPG